MGAASGRDPLQQALDDFRHSRWREVVQALAPMIDGCRDLDTIRIFALSLAELGHSAEAIDLLLQAVELHPQSAVARVNLASALRRGGQYERAEQELRSAIALDPQLAAAAFNLGNLLKSQARLGEARAPLERAIALAPAHVDARVALGEVLKALGEVPAAVAQFRAAIELRPQCGAAWWGIANLKTVPLSAADGAKLDALWSGTLAQRDRETLGFARASAHATHSGAERAWQVLLEANAVAAANRPFDAAAFRDELAHATHGLAALPPTLAPTQVIFIVGLPRSGSTLVEQMLSAHPQLAAAGELPDLPNLVARRRREQGTEWREAMTTEDWAKLGSEYLHRTQRWRTAGQALIDKLPDNLLRVDVILRMLPSARVIDCRRDARDCALSCLQQYFAHGNAFSFDLEALAIYQRGYRELLDQARVWAPERVFGIAYERLVQQPSAVLQELLDFLGLPFDTACLHPERVRREVRTASAAQVVEPLDQRGIGRWRRFEREFAGWDERGVTLVALT
ncbi:MAG: sulfotransferase [Xanthomonadales bacterium]|nr:sulfotransferase [Xanthomonadales bacterium]